MKTIVKIGDKVDTVVRVLSTLLLIVFSLVALLQVVLRNLFPAHIATWADGVCRYTFVWATYLGCALVTRRRKQIEVTVVSNLFKGKAKEALRIVISIAMLFLCVIIIRWGVYGVLLTVPQSADTLNISVAWIYASIPVGIALTAFQTIVTLCEDFIGKSGKDEEVTLE